MSSSTNILSVNDLSPGERELVAFSQTGTWWSAPNQTFGPTTTDTLASERVIRARVLYQLLTGHGELSLDAQGETVSVRAVRIMSATITEALDLRGATLRCSLELVNCNLVHEKGPCVLREVTGPYLRMSKCRFPEGLDAQNINIQGDVDLGGIAASKPVRLDRARIGGSLYLTGATLSSRGKTVLSADETDIRGSLFLDSGFRSVGMLRLVGTRIGQSLEASGGNFLNSGGGAIDAPRISVEGGVFARSGFECEGSLDFNLAKVGGIVDFSGAEISNEGGVALSFEGATVGRDMLFRTGFEAAGALVLTSCSVGGTLSLDGARIFHEGMRSIDAGNLQVEGGAFFRSGFYSEGEIHMLSASIGKQLSFDGAFLNNPGSNALAADHLSVGGSLHFRSKAHAEGRLRLWGCQISGSIEISGSSLHAPDAAAIVLEQADIKSALRLLPESLEGVIDLRSAQVDVLIDGKVSRKTHTFLRGFRYDSLIPESPRVDIRERLTWLRLDPEGYSSQPYSQLAIQYQKKGYAAERRRVLIESQKVQRNQYSGLRGLLARGWSILLRITLGYGYQPWLAVVWLGAFLGGGSIIVGILKEQSNQNFVPIAGAPDFNAMLYTADTLLPFIDFGYSKWVPHAGGQVISVLLVVAGWVLATMLIAAFTGVLRRGE